MCLYVVVLIFNVCFKGHHAVFWLKVLSLVMRRLGVHPSITFDDLAEYNRNRLTKPEAEIESMSQVLDIIGPNI